MTKELIIIALVIALIYLYYQQRKKTLFCNTSDPEKAREISETIANLQSEIEDLVGEKDSATRKKNETEQELIAVSNKLKNKQQEVSRKDQEIQRIKDEKSKVEIALNAKLKELKEKYSKQGQLLDTEQTENNKLTSQISQLETKITELEKEKSYRSSSPMPGEFPESDKEELLKTHQDQLRAINSLFDANAKDYQAIDYNGLYSLLQQIAEREREREREREQNKPPTNIQPPEKKKEIIYSLTDFINWLETKKQHSKIFSKVDWDYYRAKENNWVKEFTNWNRLKFDRLELLKKWQLEVDQKNNYD